MSEPGSLYTPIGADGTQERCEYGGTIVAVGNQGMKLLLIRQGRALSWAMSDGSITCAREFGYEL
jgi:hypothetical protein